MTPIARAANPLDLVHSDLDEFPVHPIGGYKWTATYLDNHSSYGVMFYPKSKDEEFTAFKVYQAWSKKQTGTTLKCKKELAIKHQLNSSGGLNLISHTYESLVAKPGYTF